MIRPATLAELRACPDLIVAAGAETGIEPAVQWEALDKFEQSGALKLLAVEDAAGQLVGYACALLGGELWRKSRSLTTVSLFVQARHRWANGWPLLRELARLAQHHDAKLRVQTLPGSRLERLCRLLGFAPTAVTFEVAPKDVFMHYSAHGSGSHRRRSACLSGDLVGAATRRREAR